MTSRRQIAPLQRDDIPELSRFLSSGFGVPANSFFLSPDVLAWKYFDGPSGPSGNLVRSLIARSGGKIVGHVGICFRQLIVSGDGAAPIPTMHAVDWLGSTSHPGFGALLLLEAFASSKTQFAVGGTTQAQSLFSRLGLERKSKVTLFRRVFAPLDRLHRTDQSFVRKWAGTAKDILSFSRARSQPVPQRVELRPVPGFTEEIDCLLQRCPLRMVTCQRDHLLLNYLLRYPLSGFSGWTIHAAERTIGFALLKITPQGEARLGKIVDCWLDTEDQSYWQAAVAALIDRLRVLSAGDVTCYAINPKLHEALLRNGFTKSGERIIYIRDKQQLLPRDLPFALSEFDADGAIL